MLEALIAYFISQAITLTWFYSPLKGSIAGYLLKKEDYYSNEDFDNLILFKNKKLGKLLSCYFCFSFWTSLIITLIIAFIYNIPFILECAIFGFCIVLNNLYNTIYLWTQKK